METDHGLELVQSSSPHGDRTPEGREINASHNNQSDTFLIKEGATKKIVSTYPLQFRNGQKGIVTVISSLWPVNDILTTHFHIRLYSVLGTIILLVMAIVLQQNPRLCQRPISNLWGRIWRTRPSRWFPVSRLTRRTSP